MKTKFLLALVLGFVGVWVIGLKLLAQQPERQLIILRLSLDTDVEVQFENQTLVFTSKEIFDAFQRLKASAPDPRCKPIPDTNGVMECPTGGDR